MTSGIELAEMQNSFTFTVYSYYITKYSLVPGLWHES